MRFRLVPTDDKFFELFSQSAANVARCARALQELLADIGDLPGKIDGHGAEGVGAPEPLARVEIGELVH